MNDRGQLGPSPITPVMIGAVAFSGIVVFDVVKESQLEATNTEGVTVLCNSLWGCSPHVPWVEPLLLLGVAAIVLTIVNRLAFDPL